MKLAMFTLAFGCALMLTLLALAADRANSKPAKATRPAAVGRVWPAETLSGRIMMVKPEQRLMVGPGRGWSAIR